MASEVANAVKFGYDQVKLHLRCSDCFFEIAISKIYFNHRVSDTFTFSEGENFTTK